MGGVLVRRDVGVGEVVVVGMLGMAWIHRMCHLDVPLVMAGWPSQLAGCGH